MYAKPPTCIINKLYHCIFVSVLLTVLSIYSFLIFFRTEMTFDEGHKEINFAFQHVCSNNITFVFLFVLPHSLLIISSFSIIRIQIIQNEIGFF